MYCADEGQVEVRLSVGEVAASGLAVTAFIKLRLRRKRSFSSATSGFPDCFAPDEDPQPRRGARRPGPFEEDDVAKDVRLATPLGDPVSGQVHRVRANDATVGVCDQHVEPIR